MLAKIMTGMNDGVEIITESGTFRIKEESDGSLTVRETSGKRVVIQPMASNSFGLRIIE